MIQFPTEGGTIIPTPDPIDTCPVCEQILRMRDQETNQRVVKKVLALAGLNPAAVRECIEALKSVWTNGYCDSPDWNAEKGDNSFYVCRYCGEHAKTQETIPHDATCSWLLVKKALAAVEGKG